MAANLLKIQRLVALPAYRLQFRSFADPGYRFQRYERSSQSGGDCNRL